MISNHLNKIKRTSDYDFLNRSNFLRLDRNERNFPFSKKIIANLKEKINNYSLQSYPADKKCLANKIAKLEKIDLKYIEIVPGSDSAIKYIFELFSFKKSGLSSIFPTYGMIDVYSKIYQSKLVKIKPQSNEKFDFKKYFTKKVGWIYIANPNQPDGSIITKKNIIEVIKYANKKKILVVIDEAYIHFSAQASLTNYVKRFNNLVILKTFSKFPGLAGLRIGYLIGNPKFIKLFNTVRPIFDTSSISILIAEYFLDNKKIGKNHLKEIKLSKKYMIKECKKRNLKFINTETNFFYIKIRGYQLQKIHKKLMQKGILVRSNLIGNFKFINNTIRVTLSSTKYMKKFFKALDKIKLVS